MKKTWFIVFILVLLKASSSFSMYGSTEEIPDDLESGRRREALLESSRSPQSHQQHKDFSVKYLESDMREQQTDLNLLTSIFSLRSKIEGTGHWLYEKFFPNRKKGVGIKVAAGFFSVLASLGAGELLGTNGPAYLLITGIETNTSLDTIPPEMIGLGTVVAAMSLPESYRFFSWMFTKLFERNSGGGFSEDPDRVLNASWKYFFLTPTVITQTVFALYVFTETNIRDSLSPLWDTLGVAWITWRAGQAFRRYNKTLQTITKGKRARNIALTERRHELLTEIRKKFLRTIKNPEDGKRLQEVYRSLFKVAGGRRQSLQEEINRLSGQPLPDGDSEESLDTEISRILQDHKRHYEIKVEIEKLKKIARARQDFVQREIDHLETSIKAHDDLLSEKKVRIEELETQKLSLDSGETGDIDDQIFELRKACLDMKSVENVQKLEGIRAEIEEKYRQIQEIKDSLGTDLRPLETEYFPLVLRLKDVKKGRHLSIDHATQQSVKRLMFFQKRLLEFENLKMQVEEDIREKNQERQRLQHNLNSLKLGMLQQSTALEAQQQSHLSSSDKVLEDIQQQQARLKQTMEPQIQRLEEQITALEKEITGKQDQLTKLLKSIKKSKGVFEKEKLGAQKDPRNARDLQILHLTEEQEKVDNMAWLHVLLATNTYSDYPEEEDYSPRPANLNPNFYQRVFGTHPPGYMVAQFLGASVGLMALPGYWFALEYILDAALPGNQSGIEDPTSLIGNPRQNAAYALSVLGTLVLGPDMINALRRSFFELGVVFTRYNSANGLQSPVETNIGFGWARSIMTVLWMVKSGIGALPASLLAGINMAQFGWSLDSQWWTLAPVIAGFGAIDFVASHRDMQTGLTYLLAKIKPQSEEVAQQEAADMILAMGSWVSTLNRFQLTTLHAEVGRVRRFYDYRRQQNEEESDDEGPTIEISTDPRPVTMLTDEDEEMVLSGDSVEKEWFRGSDSESEEGDY